jgi:hypothetical protein
VAWAEFEEKEYEGAALQELGCGRVGPVLPAGQVLESIVGYDAAADPGPDHVIWRLLAIERPVGLRLVPTLWDGAPRSPLAGRLPSAPVSLLLQFTRPEWLTDRRSGQWRLWGRAYYRFTIDGPQLALLRRLETAVGGQALVPYAAPAFHLGGSWRRTMWKAWSSTDRASCRLRA